MLTWLKIKNLALVENAEIEFTSGLNIITGETGAGKSVILSAISLLFGKRSAKSIIRKGNNRCELSAGIKLTSNLIKTLKLFFDENSINFTDDEILLRRVITPNSTRNFINDTNVTLSILGKLGDLLVDFHGPNQNQSLLKPAIQLQLLDRYGNLEQLRNKCSEYYSKIKKVKNDLSNLRSQLPDAIEAEYLKRIISEVDKLSPQPNEDKELSAEFEIAYNAKNIISIASQAKYLLYDAEESLLNQFAVLNKEVDSLVRIDEKNASVFIESIDDISTKIKDLAFDLEEYASGTELDESELNNLEERLGGITKLKRKYGPEIEDVLITADKARDRLDKLKNFENFKMELEFELEKLDSEYLTIADKLTLKRKKCSEKFSKSTVNKLIKLGFLKADISIDFQTIPPSTTGTDKIDYIFTANPGEDKLPLKKVASSGEISRVMLAIKTVLSNADEVPILIFDEVDANIGGKVATQVGNELRNLGKTHHVLCISHQPQVAAFGNSHFSVSKSVDSNNRTLTEILKLNTEEKVTEIGRMLGGGKAATKHAVEIISSQKS